MNGLLAGRTGSVLIAVAVLLLVAGCLPVQGQQAAPPPVRVLQVHGIINPMVAQYVERNLSQADAALYVLVLDTPGGSDTSMRRVIQAILGSQRPVVVYVSPGGARAASAGVFIAMAAHITAMAPGTNIGAAHPVGSQGEDIQGTMNDKVTNDAAALARSLAEMRGRDAAWAEQAVRQSVSLTDEEAADRGVIDLVAGSLDDLLGQLQGREVATAAGEVVLQLRGAPVEQVPMTLPERLLDFLFDPNVAYLLMSIGTLAVIIELFHPGVVLPGMTGAICLVLAFIAFESLPLNWGGVALILLAMVLFALDIKVAGFALSVGGGVAFVIGSLILFSPFTSRSPLMPALRVSPYLIAAMTALTAGLFVFALTAGLRAQRLPVPVRAETVIGAVGRTVSALDPLGVVQVASEQWTGVAEGQSIAAGEPVEVVALDGNKIVVRRVER